MKNMLMIAFVICVTAGTFGAADPCSAEKKINWMPQADANLPNVLILGDSISIGYTIPVREELKGVANVYRAAVDANSEINCGPTKRGVTDIDKWLGDRKWDVIHFNFGLHDLRCTDPNGVVGKSHQVEINRYTANLERIVKRLEKTGAKLIFATTTPVPEGAEARKKGDEVLYNVAAMKVMQKHGVAVDDLYSYALPKLRDIQRKKNVHYTDAGSKYLAKQVAASIRQQLKDIKPCPKQPN